MNKDYEPFGGEWVKEVMKMKKQDIVEMLKEALQKVTSNDEAYIQGYNDATKEACAEIAKNYHPNV